MNKVLVVDDEKLVRQGIITTFPWQKHGFEVVCDAGSGEKALELLERTPIDLLVTDLAMNGMSGLELIRLARKRRHDLPVVILTCHDNFKYIQEAMRLGVLDYIVKTEIEDEVVDETLMRIADKLQGISKRPGEPGAPGYTASLSELTAGLLLCGPARSSVPMELLGRTHADEWSARLAEVDAATWLLRLTAEEEARLTARITPALRSDGWLAVRIVGIGAENDQTVLHRLRHYRRHVLFYQVAKPLRSVSWADLPDATDVGAAGDEMMSRLEHEWNSPAWVYDDNRFEALLGATSGMAAGTAELRNLLYPAALEWERLLAIGKGKDLLGLADDWLYWREWELWLRGFRKAIRRTVDKNANRQIADDILRAIELMRTRSDPEAGMADIARSVNMSRGHFSRSFKKVTGRSYGEYARVCKLERAKEMILRTDEPITRVAERCGFSDYRYFSRAFRDYTGMLPTDYRRTGSPEQ